jgi:hypothetical protein
MALNNFVVTAFISNNNGTISVSSDRNKKHSGGPYSSILYGRSLADIFLTDVDCLGRNSKSFIDRGGVSFKIEAFPSVSIAPGDPYTFTVEVAHTANESHTKVESIELIPTKKSPKKRRGQTSPRKCEGLQRQDHSDKA